MCSRSTKHEGKVGREWLLSVPHEFDVPQGRSDTREWLGQNWQKETALHRDRQKYSHWTKNNWVNPQTSTTASKYQNNPSGWGAANFQRLGDYSGKTDLFLHSCLCVHYDCGQRLNTGSNWQIFWLSVATLMALTMCSMCQSFPCVCPLATAQELHQANPDVSLLPAFIVAVDVIKLHISVPSVTISFSGHYLLQGRAGNNRQECLNWRRGVFNIF